MPVVFVSWKWETGISLWVGTGVRYEIHSTKLRSGVRSDGGADVWPMLVYV